MGECADGGEKMRVPNIFDNDRGARVSYEAGAVICREGDPGDTMYIVQSGEVEIQAGGRVVEVVGPEGFFGEMALIDQAPRSAAVIARTDCVLSSITQKQFLFMVEETPFFAIRVMQAMSARLRRSTAAPAANTEA
jgi:CRP-like cAMP-binding protein